MKKYLKYLIAPFSVAIILLIIYATKGIYPFGDITIANGDMGQSYMTFYHFLYDIFYNGKSIFYDYVLGMGSNMYGGFIVDGLFNPTSFLTLLSSRENIPYIFSFIMILKVAFIALTSQILFNKLYKNKFYNTIFSIMYALSGFVLMYNTNLMWLDVVGLFPLFILAIKHMFETEKVHWYAIVLALMLIFNYNLAYMVLMFIIFAIPIYIKFGLEKEKRRKAVFNVIIGTLLSIGLSAFAFIPSFMQVMTSYRMSGVVTNTVANENILFKIVVFIFYSLPLYGYYKWLRNYNNDKNNILINGLALIFTAIIPILFERVNLLWHTGSYQMFPFRYGFIPIMILFLGALKYFDNYKEKEEKNVKNYGALLVAFSVMAIMFAGIAAVQLNMSMPAFNMPTAIFILMLLSCMCTYLVIQNICKIGNEKVKKILICVLTAAQIFTYTYAYIGVSPKYRYGREWSDEIIFTSNEIKQELDIEKSLYKIKDLTALTTENCPLVYDIPSMSTFLHLISTEQVLNCEQLGYSHNKTKLNDFGGTIFSDAVYGIKYVLSKKEMSEKIYNYIQTLENGIKLYEYKNNLPIGFVYDADVTDIPAEFKNFEAQNYLYKTMFDKQENIIKVLSGDEIQFNQNEKEYQYTFEVVDSQEVYIYLDIDKQIKNILVNGKEIIIPITNDENNKIYPTQYCNGILDIGTFENESVSISFETVDGSIAKSIKIGLLDINKYNQIFASEHENINIEIEKNKIKITGDLDKDSKLFLPVNYAKEWTITKTNNEDNEINRVYNTFIGMDLKKGEVNFELQFEPYAYSTSLKVTIITIILMILAYIIEKKCNIRNVKIIMNIFWTLGILIYVIAFYKIYVSSIIQTFFDIFS